MEAGSRVGQLVCNGRRHAGLYSGDFNADTEGTLLPLQYTPLDSVHTPTGVRLVPATYKKAHNIILTPISKSHANLREMG